MWYLHILEYDIYVQLIYGLYEDPNDSGMFHPMPHLLT